MKKNHYILLFMLMLSGTAFSQVAKEDFAAINKAYAEHPQLSMKVKYDAYKNRNTTAVFNSESGEIKQNGTAKYTRTGTIETVETEKYRLIVDHEDKNISLLGIDPDAKEKNTGKEITPANLEKLIGLYTKVEFKKLTNEQNSYTLLIPGAEYEELKLIYNSKTFFIEKMILYYAEKQNLEEQQGGLKEAPRMEITYSDLNIKPDMEKTTFSYDTFLEKRNGKLVAKPAYKTYTVNDQSFN